MPDPAPILELAGVTKSYRTPEGAETPVLRGVDLTLAPGASLAIVGPSGCGKSTLLNIIGTLDRPSAGTVSLAGRDVTALGEAELSEVRSRVVGFVFQMHHLLPQCSILENVLVPTLTGRAPDGAQDRARKLLDRVGLGARLGHRPGQLSGGECQRAAVVRALVNSPRLLLADEPTGSLDRASAESLAQLLGELNREEGVALVYVTHSSDLARRAGRVLELRDGRFEPSAK
ncbi:MAG TPA: ABC transporter ATP-binding protein [Planctomycetota bacterium]|nr:ABC transporter ATP-binding protein [Planctomycetota bacterium]